MAALQERRDHLVRQMVALPISHDDHAVRQGQIKELDYLLTGKFQALAEQDLAKDT